MEPSSPALTSHARYAGLLVDPNLEWGWPARTSEIARKLALAARDPRGQPLISSSWSPSSWSVPEGKTQKIAWPRVMLVEEHEIILANEREWA